MPTDKPKTVPGEHWRRVRLLASTDVAFPLESYITRSVSTLLAARSGARTSDCFRSTPFVKRGRPIDILLPLEQPAAATRAITALKPLNFWTIFGVVVKVLQLGRVRRAEEVEQELVTGGHTLTLTQIEALICEAETGQDVGLITNGKMNFFFVQTQHSSVPTVAVFGRRLSRGWEVNVSMFGYGHRWDGDARVVLCNLDPGKVAAATVTIQ